MPGWKRGCMAALVGGVAWASAACGAGPPAGRVATPADPAAARTIATADNALGFALLRGLTAASPAENVFISPPSLAIDLSMLYTGARGQTAAEMARVLHLGTLGPAQVEAGNAALLGALENPGKGITLDIANSLWARAGVQLAPAFLRTDARAYGAKVASVPFSSPQAVREINAWVDQNTAGNIPTLVQRLPADGVLELLDAVYFQGTWQTAFNPADTRPGPFTVPGGGTVTVPLMARSGVLPYYQGPGYQVAALPYAGGRFRMEVVLPAPGAPMPQDVAGAWTDWQSRLQPRTVALTLPRFTLTDTSNLGGQLADLGMAGAFSSQADFSGLCTGAVGCRISSVLQKTALQVDEAGTTAAAATAIGVTTAVAVQTPPAVRMDVNRPFLCALVDQTTGAVLFIGVVDDPSA